MVSSEKSCDHKANVRADQHAGQQWYKYVNHSVTLLFHRLIIKSKLSLDAVNISLDHDSVLYKMQSGSEQPIVYAKFVFFVLLPLIRPLWNLTRVFSICASDPQNGHGFNSLLIPSPHSQ